jgi:hypothetical protein
VQFLSGTSQLTPPADVAREDACADELAALWGCTVHRFPPLTAVDYYAERDGRVVGVIEIKTHPHPSTLHSRCYIDAHKLLALDLAALSFGVPAILIKRFTDGMFSIRVGDIDRATPVRVMGRQDRGRDERHPAVAIPVVSMHLVGA